MVFADYFYKKFNKHEIPHIAKPMLAEVFFTLANKQSHKHLP